MVILNSEKRSVTNYKHFTVLETMLDQLLALRYYTITLTTGKQSGKIHCINSKGRK